MNLPEWYPVRDALDRRYRRPRSRRGITSNARFRRRVTAVCTVSGMGVAHGERGRFSVEVDGQTRRVDTGGCRSWRSFEGLTAMFVGAADRHTITPSLH
jgi:hypothetical protein